MDIREKIIEYFSQFPGIGPRQSRRFMYFLLNKDEQFISRFIALLKKLRSETYSCTRCQRFFFQDTDTDICDICGDTSRDDTIILVVEHETDIDNIEKQGVYNGHYFVLGGDLPVVEKNPEKKIRIRELFDRVQSAAKNDNLTEIIIATSASPEGENTAQFIRKKLSPLAEKHDLTISTLGRGLSTGTELEYVDADTMKNALQNRG